VKETSFGGVILSKQPTLKVNFTKNKSADFETIAAFFPNPEANWGPKSRAKPSNKRKFSGESFEASKSRANQGKRQKQKPCRSWKQSGTCKFNDKCRYAHNPSGSSAFDVPLTTIPLSTSDQPVTKIS